MPQPSVVIFDLGKVLVDFEFIKAGNSIAARSNFSAEQIRLLIDHTPLLRRIELGELSSAEFFAEAVATTGYRGSFDQFVTDFADIFTPITANVELNRELRRRGLRTYILSNTSALHLEHIRRKFPFFAEFDGYVLSYEVHVMKPDAGIYAAAEKLCGKSGPEILFLDDRADNVAAAAARGWQVIHHTSPETTRAAFQRLGLI